MAQQQQAQVQLQPFEPLFKAPKEIRTASRFAQVAEGSARVTSIGLATLIIASLPTWVPGLLTLQPLPILLTILTVGSWRLGSRARYVREEICRQKLEKARSSSLTGSLIGFSVGGVLPGPFYLLLYTRIGTAMVKKVPNENQLATTTYLPPQPSNGMFLGRYLGWALMYLLVLYAGYTQLPLGLKGLSDWLSPVFGVHFNTLVVAAYLVFTNPLTNPNILWTWVTVGLVGGLIAGGRTGRGFSVALTVFISTLGAMGLAAFAIFRNVYASISSVNIPPIPTGLSITSLASGPIAQDLVPVVLRPGVSPLDPTVIQTALLILIRNAGLILTIATVSGRGGALAWQGGVFSAKTLRQIVKGRTETNEGEARQVSGGSSPPLIKTAVLLLLAILSMSLGPSPITHTARSQLIEHATSPTGPYEQFLSVGFDQFGSPNASIGLTNLDLSSKGLLIGSDYDQSNCTMLVINNNYPEGLRQGGGSNNIPLNLFSQPTLVTMYSSLDGSTALSRSNNVAEQFSHALGTTFAYSLSIPFGNDWISLYAAGSGVSNGDMLVRTLAILPPASFGGLVNPARIRDQKFSLAFGLIPGRVGNFSSSRSFSFMLSAGFPRLFFKEGPHTFSLAGLLGSSSNISGDTASNASIVNIDFERGTKLLSYSPVSTNTFYVPQTWTLILNATAGFSSPDLTASFSYPFAPDIVFDKKVEPSTGTVGTTHTVTISFQNLDNVTVNMVNMTDNQVLPVYRGTVELSPDSTQIMQAPSLAPGQAVSTSYLLTTKSSGIYMLSSQTGQFSWRLANGTLISYTMETEGPMLDSQSGPTIQINRTFNDLAPYSVLLLIPFFLPPVMETIGLFRRRTRKARERRETSQASTTT